MTGKSQTYMDGIRQARQIVSDKSTHTTEMYDDALELALAIAARLGALPQIGARVLDFGCGQGGTVKAMLARGYDAWGVDVGEWWGKDGDILWHLPGERSEDVLRRLSVTDERVYRLPYPDDHFDFVMSSQVFEHVFNYTDVFRELGRVLKPGAVSVNVFPGLLCPIEPHVGIPVTAFAHNPIWLLAWSLVRRKHFPSWSEEYKYLRAAMAPNNYPSRRTLRRHASDAGVTIKFEEQLYIEYSNSRPHQILTAAARAHLDWAISPALELLCQRAMILTKSTTALPA